MFMGPILYGASAVIGGSFVIIDLMEINDQHFPTVRRCEGIKKCGKAPKGHMSLQARLALAVKTEGW